jgi:hypothetical protein
MAKAQRRLRAAILVRFTYTFSDRFYSEIVGEYGARPLYRMLGYFSLIGLLRVHVLLGDFTLALKVMENVELNQKVSNNSFLFFVLLTCDRRHPSRA